MPTQPQLASQPLVTDSRIPEIAAEAALVPTSEAGATGISLDRNAFVARLPVEIDVAVPIRDFRVRNLLALTEGDVIASQWVQEDDLPLGAPDTQLAWAEFEVVDQKLAVRITRLP